MERLDPKLAEASSTHSTDSSQALERKELILSCQRVLFAAYRTDQYADPEGFIASLGLVFSQYPNDVITHVTDPRTGVQRGKTFPPSIAEIVSACDARLADKARMRRYMNWGRNDPTPLLEGPKNEDRPTYDDLKAKFGDSWGIGAEEKQQKVAKPAPNVDQLRHHYQHYYLAFKPKQQPG